MDPMVLKYLALAGAAYGIHACLAVAQILLCVYLTASGLVLLSSKERLGKWAGRFGLVVNQDARRSKSRSWLMIVTGVSLALPLFGIPYWVAVIACPVAIFWLLSMTKGVTDPTERKAGSAARTGLILSAVLICGLTIWEERDLVYAGYIVNYKAIYWRHKEVSVWQHENNPNVPKIGALAPDFELSDSTGTNTIRLSDLRGEKPVVLLFGSFT